MINIPSKIDKLIGSAIARVTIDGGFLIRHFNQIWNRMPLFLPRIQEPMIEEYSSFNWSVNHSSRFYGYG